MKRLFPPPPRRLCIDDEQLGITSSELTTSDLQSDGKSNAPWLTTFRCQKGLDPTLT